MIWSTEMKNNSFIHVENLRLPRNQAPINCEKCSLSKTDISPLFLNKIKKFKRI